MADNLTDFMNEFDELSREASQATYNLFVPRLKHFQSFLDTEDDTVQAHVSFLKNRLPWDELKTKYMVDEGGMGGEKIRLPDDRLDTLSLYVNLFSRMADGSVPAEQTVLTYFRGRSRDMNGAHSNMIDQLFNPYAAALGRYIQKNYDEDPPEDADSIIAPASDRSVTINHNSAEYQQTEAEITELIELLRSSNDYDDPEDKAQRIAELEASQVILKAPTVRASALKALLVDCLVYLVKKLGDGAASELAKRLAAFVIGWLF